MLFVSSSIALALVASGTTTLRGSRQIQLCANEYIPLLDEENSVIYLNGPAPTTVTFFGGSPPIELLRGRLARVIRANPWLAGRLQRRKRRCVLAVGPLEEDDAEGVDVGRGRDGAGAGVFGVDVPPGPLEGLRRDLLAVGALDEAAEAEVGELGDDGRVRQEHVGRLDVRVDDGAVGVAVEEVEAPGDVDRDAEAHAPAQGRVRVRRAAEALLDGAAARELVDEVVVAVVDAVAQEEDEVPVRELREALDFGRELLGALEGRDVELLHRDLGGTQVGESLSLHPF